MTDLGVNPAEMPGLPEPTDQFTRLPESWFRIVIRKAQGFTAEQICKEFGLSKRTVSGYAERAKDKLGYDTQQELMWAVYRTYAPGLWLPYWDKPDG